MIAQLSYTPKASALGHCQEEFTTSEIIHPIWQFLFFLQAWRARNTTGFERNGPTRLHINVHPVVHQLFETGTFCPVSVHHTAQRDAQPQEPPQPLHMSRCMKQLQYKGCSPKLYPTPTSHKPWFATEGKYLFLLHRRLNAQRSLTLAYLLQYSLCCLQVILFTISSLL